MQNIYVPDTLNDGYFFQHHYDLGARIHSNSWGNAPGPDPTDQNIYDSGSQDVDQFMWDHKDFLILFAAGNSGDNGEQNSIK